MAPGAHVADPAAGVAVAGARPQTRMILDGEPINDVPIPLGVVFQSAPDAIILVDADGRVSDWNPEAERMFGYSREQARGTLIAELIIPGPLREAHRNGLQRYLQTRVPTIVGRRIELSALNAAGEEFPVELTLVAIEDQEPPHFLGFLHDLRKRHRALQENVRLSQRMAFLAQTGPVLDRSLEPGETLRGLAELAVPELAALAVIDLVGDDGRVQRAVAAALDPAQAREVERMRLAHPITLESPHPVAAVLRTGQPVLLPSMRSEFLAGIATDPDHLELMRRMRYHSAIVVPLTARRRVLGTLSLLQMADGAEYNRDDLVLAEELARRAALALDNTRLFAVTRNLARTLQESLLPQEVPAMPHARIAAVYRAAAEGQVVGGDFYDAFEREDGSWTVAIGDVCGKGPEAAALTALARYTIRALGDLPAAEVLSRLNHHVHRDQRARAQRFLTAQVIQAWPQPGRVRLELAAGGHPPPLVLRANGEVGVIPVGGPLVGMVAEQRFSPAQAELAAGDTVVLYTDGLTDAQAPQRVVTGEELLEHLRACAGLGPDELLERLQQDAVGDAEPRDDIALLALQVPRG